MTAPSGNGTVLHSLVLQDYEEYLWFIKIQLAVGILFFPGHFVLLRTELLFTQTWPPAVDAGIGVSVWSFWYNKGQLGSLTNCIQRSVFTNKRATPSSGGGMGFRPLTGLSELLISS